MEKMTNLRATIFHRTKWLILKLYHGYVWTLQNKYVLACKALLLARPKSFVFFVGKRLEDWQSVVSPATQLRPGQRYIWHVNQAYTYLCIATWTRFIDSSIPKKVSFSVIITSKFVFLLDSALCKGTDVLLKRIVVVSLAALKTTLIYKGITSKE